MRHKTMKAKYENSFHSAKNKDNLLTALVAGENGEIIELDGYAALGMAGSSLEPLTIGQTRKMPFGGELMFLPDRFPILLNLETGNCETVRQNPFAPSEKVYPVAAFNSPGYVNTWVSAYQEKKNPQHLPLFSYAAIGWHRGNFRSSIIQVDRERRQDLRLMKRSDVLKGIKHLQKQMPANRLREHLEKCALHYGCPAAKNFFLGRYEAPLPTAARCNARCLGCLSSQKSDQIHHSQDRIRFTPSAKEIAQVALFHIKRVKKSVVSFGQGCEGDPLMVAGIIEAAIRSIRSETKRGTININTNGSLPEGMRRLFKAGLDSMRISMNSVRPRCYHAYFRPKGYDFKDVLKSIEIALEHNIFVAINYLNCPGFSDTTQEFRALIRFLEKYPIQMIQWRNLNFDPLRYWRVMNGVARHSRPQGMATIIARLSEQFPKLKQGYYNPPKENF
jgi:pyruvate-formate lyase-activating enzyme